MVKLSSGKEVCPFPRIVGAEDTKICFNFLIGLLSLSVCLRMISVMLRPSLALMSYTGSV